MDYVFELAPALVSCYTPLLLPGSGLSQKREALDIRFDPRPPHRIFSHCSLDYDQMLECLEFGLDVCQEYNSLSRAQQRAVSFEQSPTGSPRFASPASAPLCGIGQEARFSGRPPASRGTSSAE